MSEELVMPRLSDTMEEGTIGRWLVHEGDSFSEGDVLAEIETDKALMEFQAYDAGTVLKILVEDGESAALGSPDRDRRRGGRSGARATAPPAEEARPEARGRRQGTSTAAEQEAAASAQQAAQPGRPRPPSNGSAAARRR